MLRVLEKARSKCPIEISSTFCGAHSVPKGSTAAEVLPINLIDSPFLRLTVNRSRNDGCVYTGNHRCDRETAASSFEAERGRSPLQPFFGNKATFI